MDDVVTLEFTGDVQTIQVPDHVIAAAITVKGGEGGNGGLTSWSWSKAGYGAIVKGTIPVDAGDALTVAVGGAGGDPDGNKRPGAGGWSLPQYQGGKGGSGHGAETSDAGGGGGASVVQLDGQTQIIAAAGGGKGGRQTKAAPYFPGGWGGNSAGENGQQSTNTDERLSGYGGSAKHPTNNPAGGSYSGALIKAGGGGGGGGYYVGEGGKNSGYGGGGGGGGSSYAHPHVLGLDVSTVDDGCTSLSSCDKVFGGAGRVSIAWQTAPDSDVTYTIQKTDAPNSEVVSVPASAVQGTPVNLVRRSEQNGAVSDLQLWTYKFSGRAGFGQFQNSNTGLCLEQNGADGKVDQWPCQAGQPNQEWILLPRADGGTAIALSSSQPLAPLYLATKDPSEVVKDGAELILTADLTDERTAWDLNAIAQ